LTCIEGVKVVFLFIFVERAFAIRIFRHEFHKFAQIVLIIENGSRYIFCSVLLHKKHSNWRLR